MPIVLDTARATSETNRLPVETTTFTESLRKVWREGLDSEIHAVEAIGVEDAVGWIEESARGKRPFFLFLDFNSSHMPYTPRPTCYPDS